MSSQHLTIAVYKVCVTDPNDAEVHKRRIAFLQSLGEYIFDNMWQDDNRHYTQNTYLFMTFQAAIADPKIDTQKTVLLAKALLQGFYRKLINKKLTQVILKGIVLNQETDPVQEAWRVCEIVKRQL